MSDDMTSTQRRVVVIAIDASENAMSAFRWYMKEIYRKDDHVILCHVPEQPDFPTFSFKRGLSPPIDDWQKALQDRLEDIKKLEHTYDKELIGKKVSYKFNVEQSKNAGQGIVNVIESEKAELVVIGTRGLDRLRRTLLGSVSDYVVRQSKVPVLVCPMN